jgi:hypothetical protein
MGHTTRGGAANSKGRLRHDRRGHQGCAALPSSWKQLRTYYCPVGRLSGSRNVNWPQLNVLPAWYLSVKMSGNVTRPPSESPTTERKEQADLCSELRNKELFGLALAAPLSSRG